MADWTCYSTKLKPCPFCGAEPWGIFGEPAHDERALYVECHGDECPDVVFRWLDTKEEVAQAYNKRPSEQS